jgi:DNA-binding CsgD family transcriptional regulator
MSAHYIEAADLSAYHLPVPKSATIRHRITKRILEAATYPIIFVIAPAGFGKTTAIHHALAQRESAIFIATPRAATLEQFVNAFARGCSRYFPEMALPPHESSAGTANAEGNLDIYTAWASTHLRNAKCTIVIDDLHHADDSHAVANFLGRLADSSKTCTQWVFSSRTQGNLPITRWQAYGDADAPITADDLRMTVDEAVVIASSLNSPATVEQLASLVAQTHGFPVPLTYAIRLSARRGSIASIMEVTRSFTFGFLAQQLWGSLRVDEIALLEVAAYLPPIHIHAYENAGHEKASSVISRLCDEIAFLSLTSTGILSMHDLFRDFVRLQVSLSGPRRQVDRRNSAVAILLQSRHYNEAFELLIESSDASQLADAIETFSANVSDLSVTQRIVCATEHVQLAKLGLEALYLQTEYWSWFDEPHKARLFAEEIIRRKDAPSRHLFCALQSITRVSDAAGPEEQLDWLNRMPEIQSRLDEADRTQAFACQASLLARFPETHSEARSLARQVHRKMRVLDSIAQVNAQTALASTFFYLGETELALSATREAVAVARAVKNDRELARTLNNFGLMLMSVYDSEVESIFDPLRDAVERTGSWRFAQTSHWFQAGYHAWKGDAAAALAARELQLAIITSGSSQKSRLKGVQRHSANLCHLIGGDFHAVIADLEKNGVPKETDIAYGLLTDAAAAHVLLSNFTECDDILKRARRLHDSLPAHSANLVRQALFVEIIALCAMGHRSQAKRLYDQHRESAPRLASIDKAFLFFCQGPPFVAVNDVLGRCLHQPYVGLFALLMKRVIEASKQQTEMLLSAVEIEVLRLLALGRSNKDIATARSRSSETIKRQVSSIYKKLGVDSRTSAVAIARERGLL